ncbi:DNA-3-methyladenine glycosylase I [Philodulcilactobacillus myokoensis]|uniref:DNA-3-methyladenine glycosylase I n=1 Tax=Philodulcilactobacillus myokoensis TaxID=2929573 RepID=A0A9W6AZ07_9LACO|nr:DNA-3-methyladenine glycosylase I [Philodulcilactobacillus myokoensis]GLB46217.1 DNA-3-methyladenine glycosylase I [Philodulcilactobacillus myokoensis]
MKTCPFSRKSLPSKFFHDYIWGVPKTDERQLFELLTLETFQAGLTWQMILKKRHYFEVDFKHFDWLKIGHMSNHQIKQILGDDRIIRNHQKIMATVNNARALIQMHKHHQSLSKITWQPVKYHPVTHKKHKNYALPTKHWVHLYLPIFKKYHFKFVGPKILYSYLQGAGVINDHVTSCYRYREIIKEDKQFAHAHLKFNHN